MKTTLTLFTLILNLMCFAQYSISEVEITTDLQYNGINRTTKINADSTFHIQIQYNKNKPVLTGRLVSIDPEIKDGSFIFYSPTSKPIAMGKYNQGYPSGIWKYYKTDGSLELAFDFNSVIEFLNERLDQKLDEEPFIITDKMPEFEGAEADHFMNFLKQNAIYPIYSIINKSEGDVIVKIIIDKNGKIINPEIIRGVDTDINMEVYRLLSLSPDWAPGKDKKGRPKNVTLVLPLKFKLPESPCDSTFRGKINTTTTFALAGRKAEHLNTPQNPNCLLGDLSFEIYVNKSGAVTDCVFLREHSSKASSIQIKEFEKAIYAMEFSANNNAPYKQKGSITFHFTYKL